MTSFIRSYSPLQQDLFPQNLEEARAAVGRAGSSEVGGEDGGRRAPLSLWAST